MLAGKIRSDMLQRYLNYFVMGISLLACLRRIRTDLIPKSLLSVSPNVEKQRLIPFEFSQVQFSEFCVNFNNCSTMQA